MASSPPAPPFRTLGTFTTPPSPPLVCTSLHFSLLYFTLLYFTIIFVLNGIYRIIPLLLQPSLLGGHEGCRHRRYVREEWEQVHYKILILYFCFCFNSYHLHHERCRNDRRSRPLHCCRYSPSPSPPLPRSSPSPSPSPPLPSPLSSPLSPPLLSSSPLPAISTLIYFFSCVGCFVIILTIKLETAQLQK